MQAVQFSSWSAMTPRARVGGASFSCGYCTVCAPTEGRGIGFLAPSGNSVRIIVRNVTPRPLTKPGSCGIYSTTFRTPVIVMLSRLSGIRNFHASRWS